MDAENPRASRSNLRLGQIPQRNGKCSVATEGARALGIEQLGNVATKGDGGGLYLLKRKPRDNLQKHYTTQIRRSQTESSEAGRSYERSTITEEVKGILSLELDSDGHMKLSLHIQNSTEKFEGENYGLKTDIRKLRADLKREERNRMRKKGVQIEVRKKNVQTEARKRDKKIL